MPPPHTHAQSQIFLQIENELQRNNPANESFFLANNGSTSTNNAGFLFMYLQACKFLDLAISMPADSLPQFQLGKHSNKIFLEYQV